MNDEMDASTEAPSGSESTPPAGPEASRPAPRGRTRGRTARARERLDGIEGRDDAFVLYFKERIYATFTGLAILLVVAGDENHDAEHALLALLFGVLGITMAGFVSDVIAHLAVHREFPRRQDMEILLRIAGGALSTVVVPGALLALAWAGVFTLEGCLRAGIIVYMVTLGVIGWFAVRRSKLEWWKQALVLVVLIALGLGVIGLQTLAHSA